jgi:hypothetical protein
MQFCNCDSTKNPQLSTDYRINMSHKLLKILVGAEGFEPLTLCSQRRLNNSLNLIEICRRSVLLIEMLSAYRPALVDLCEYWVL